MAKTVVALYDNYADAQSAVQDLEISGFDRRSISVVANDVVRHPSVVLSEASEESGGPVESDIAGGAGAGAIGGGIAGLIVGFIALAIPGVGPILAFGPLAAMLVGAGVGLVLGGILGALIHVGVPEQQASYYAEGVRRGGTLVTVQTDDSLSERALDIMDHHSPVDVEERASLWRGQGWTGYNPRAAAYTADQIAQERAQYAESAPGPVLPADTIASTTPTYQAGVPVPPVVVAPVNVTQTAPVAPDVPPPTTPNPPAGFGRRPAASYNYMAPVPPLDDPPMPMDTVPADRDLVGAKGGEANYERPGARPDDYQNSALGGDVDPFDTLTENP